MGEHVSFVISHLSVSFGESYTKFIACTVLACVNGCLSLIVSANNKKALISSASFVDTGGGVG